jgi:hypothetical protein
MKIFSLLSCVPALLGFASGSVHGQTINLRMSVKIIVSSTTGARPSGINPQVFTNAVAAANNWMAGYQRGYRYQLTEVTDIGGPTQGGSSGPSQWYNVEFRNDPERAVFFAIAKTNSLYLLRSDQINIYVATGFSSPGNSGGAMPIPPGEVNYTGGQIYADDGAWWLVHELGHFFGLSHTFAGETKASCTPGDDGIADTLPDSNCWTTSDQAAQHYFQKNYSALSAAEQAQVDDFYFNAMSYHEATSKNSVENHLTELQLDRITLHANGDRHPFATGYTRFVSLTGNNSNSGLDGGAPKRTVLNAANASGAGGSDIVLVRPGNYNEQITINNPVTLRAPRTGWATIGKP